MYKESCTQSLIIIFLFFKKITFILLEQLKDKVFYEN